jgi:hypothetical protein
LPPDPETATVPPVEAHGIVREGDSMVDPTGRSDASESAAGSVENQSSITSPAKLDPTARLPFVGSGVRQQPVVIGGVGGSGTRVISSMIAGLGYDMGISLHQPSRDDLLFTFLFHNPDAYLNVHGLIPSNHPSAVEALDLYVAMRNGEHGTGLKRKTYRRALSLSTLPYEEPRGLKRPVTRAARRYRQVQFVGQEFGKISKSEIDPSQPWGWKVPFGHLFLPTMHAGIPELRYIHVVRDGPAVAKSRNDRQCKNWGRLFGITEDGRDPQLAQLVYWARVNMAVADFLANGPQSLIVSYERSVLEPAAVLQEMATFLGRPVTDEAMAVVAGVRRPTDFDRAYDYASAPLTAEEREDVVRAIKRFSRPEPVTPSTQA